MLDPVLSFTQSEQISAVLPPLWHQVVCHPPVVAPDATIFAAIRDWSDGRQHGCIAIVRDGQFRGLLTESEIVRLTAERQDLASLTIGTVISENIVTLKTTAFTDLSIAVDVMAQHQLRYLPIVDDCDCLVGVVTAELLHQQIAADLAVTAQRQTYRLQQRETQLQKFFDLKRDRSIHSQTEQTIRQQAERELVLREITQRIRQSLDLAVVFATATREIREFMATDRVAILKFESNFNLDEGEFIAESVGNGFESILGAQIQAPGFGEKLAAYYQKGSVNAIENIHAAGLLDDEIAILAKFQVQANLVIPLLDGPQLWGLLCIHHCSMQRSWQASEIAFIDHVAEQIGIAIQQATLYQKVQSELAIRWRTEAEIALQLRQQQALGEIAQQIRNSLKVEEILATATSQVKDLMQVDRSTIFRVFPDGHIRAVEEVVEPEYPSLVSLKWERQPFTTTEIEFYLQGQPRIAIDIQDDYWSQNISPPRAMAGVKSKIVAPILLPASEGEAPQRSQLWGLLSVHSYNPQRHWQAAEAKLLQQIADQLAIAIHQASLFEQLQAELAERQQAEAQLRERNQELARATRLKDEFLANMSHELRTPLNAILGMSEALQDSAFGSINERQLKSISSIEKSGKHLLALINDILDLSKIEANKLDLELTKVSIDSLCKNSILFIKELAHKRQICLTTQIPEEIKQLQLRVDDLRYRQVLINLLSNAVKFTPEGGHVTLDVRIVERSSKDRFGASTDDDLVAIDRQGPGSLHRRIAFSVVDTGIGIAPHNIDKLFQSFVQVDSSLNRQYAGTGLGLALVKKIVELHGGTVSVESALDRGSCFTVYLPLDPSAEIAATPALPPLVYPIPITQDLPSIEKATILVVEDNQANMETMTGYLKSRGYRPLEAKNGQQGIDMALDRCPDLILMDIQMPGMDGFEAITRIRQLSACATIPIVALTALAMPTDRQKCLDAGADRYVSKPVKLGQLVVTIEALLHGD